MKNISKLIMALAIVATVSFAAIAQPGSTTGGDPFGDEPVDDVPLDGGISLLAIAGAAYGYKKIKNSNHNKK